MKEWDTELKRTGIMLDKIWKVYIVPEIPYLPSAG